MTWAHWTQERTARATEMWLTGKISAGKIARELGCTRSAVIGRMRRLNVITPPRHYKPPRVRKARAPDEHKVKRKWRLGAAALPKIRVHASRTRPVPPINPEDLLFDANDQPDQNSRTLMEMPMYGVCHWPYTQLDGSLLYCGRETEKTYCRRHCKKMYV